jgi:predicted phosphoribosyltransferase
MTTWRWSSSSAPRCSLRSPARQTFRDRAEAGRNLAERLREDGLNEEALVLALPRGGVPVAFEIARGLGAPLDVFVVRKLGMPGHEELALGAIASGGTRVVNDDLVAELGIGADVLDRVAAREAVELERRERLYRGGRPAVGVTGRTVVLVDDGIATGATVRAAVSALRAGHPARIVVAVPTASRSALSALRSLADVVVCLVEPEPFVAVALSYLDFSEVSDDDVRALLSQA